MLQNVPDSFINRLLVEVDGKKALLPSLILLCGVSAEAVVVFGSRDAFPGIYSFWKAGNPRTTHEPPPLVNHGNPASKHTRLVECL